MASEVPGILPGELSVTQTGAAHYTIPLVVPPGTAGMQPNLSLSYNSKANGLIGTGRSLMGVGWSLKGLSAITRCGRTLVQDGASGGIEFTDNDRFCLDGQRLVAVNGAYGHSGTEYRTEIDRFARIVSHGRLGKGPAWFSVQTKSGQTIQYGNTGDARIEAQGRSEVFTWAQNRVTDATGNSLTVTYRENNANTEYYPLRIDYSGVSVRFEYVNKPDLGDSYIANAKIKSTKRLARIKTFVGNRLVHHYALTYKARTDKQALLQAVEQCDGAGDCLPPIHFAWHEAAEQTTYGGYRPWIGSGYPLMSVATQNDHFSEKLIPKTFDLVDMNRDGRQDVVVSFGAKTYSWVNDERSYYLSTGSGFYSAGKVTAHKQYPLAFGDVDGDGLADAVRTNSDNYGMVEVALGTGNGFSGFRTWLSSGYPKYTYTDGNGDNQYIPYRFDLVDLNGDGRLDLAARAQAVGWNNIERKLFKSTGSGFVPSGSLSACRNCRLDIGDVSGDGVADAIRVTDNKTEVALGTSRGFGPYRSMPAADSKRTAARKAQSCTDCELGFGDVNGDGIEDVVRAKLTRSANKGMVEVALGRTPDNDRLTHITDSLGNLTTISYAKATDAGMHTLTGAPAYPTRHMRFPALIVSAVESDNGLGGTQRTTYRYGSGKTHLKGRGFLGFAWMKATDTQTGITTTTTYRQDFPYTGKVAATEQRQANGKLLGRTTATWAKRTQHGGKTHFPYISRSVDDQYQLDGHHIATTTTSQYDGYGNPTRITATTTGGGEQIVKESLNQYLNNTDRWHLGRLTRASVTHTTDQGRLTKTSAFAYNANGLLSQEIVEPDSQALRLVTDTTYDRFGNKIKTTTSGNGVTPRTTTTNYTPDGRFPTSTTNALGHTETYTYDPLHGVMTSLRGPNGLTTRWQYDRFGRKTREDRADGTWSTITRGFCQHGDCLADAPWNAALVTTTQSAGSTPTTTYADRLGRVIREQRVGFDGTSVYQDTEYNALGQIHRVSLPYFAGEASYWTTNTYDLLGRVTRTDSQQSNGATRTTHISHRGRTTVTTDPLGHQKTTTKNLQGKIARVEQEEHTWVNYTYDPIGNLTRTDSNGSITELSYDLRGRKSAMNDPNMGRWQYRYNAFGELTSQTDAKGQTVTMQYDPLGRMIKRTEPEGTTTWQYDIAAHGIGKLHKVTGPDGYTKTHTYDSLGRPQRTEQHAAGTTLAHQLEYDRYGRINKETRPNGFILTKHYNAQGYLEAIRAPATQIGDYDILHLSKTWQTLQPQLEQQLQDAQQQADRLMASANVYRDQAKLYGNMALQLQAQPPKPAFSDNQQSLEQIIRSLQQASTSLYDFANKLNRKAAEYQRIADTLLSYLPERYQDQWFKNTLSRYSDIVAHAVEHYRLIHPHPDTRVWTPIMVGGITTFIQAKPGPSVERNLNTKERQYLKTIALWAQDAATLLNTLADDVRQQQRARDKMAGANANYQTLKANNTKIWVPINVGDITTFIPTDPTKPTAHNTLNTQELASYQAADFRHSDMPTLAAYYLQRLQYQQHQQRRIEAARSEQARTASALKETREAYTQSITAYHSGQKEITFWRATARDAAGRLTQHINGNGLITQNHYDQASGQLHATMTGFNFSADVRHISYQYDLANNLLERTDERTGFYEQFSYDRLERLTHTSVYGRIGSIDYHYDVSQTYDAQGNITHKSDVGDYQYDPNRSQQLTSAGTKHIGYQYDANGNITQGGGRTFQWASYNKPTKLQKGNNTVSFNYGAEHNRYRKVARINGETTTIDYFGKLYEKETSPSAIDHKHHIYADGNLVAIHIEHQQGGADETRYLHYDALGSIDTITDGQGKVIERMSYDPWGKRRGGDWRIDDPLNATQFHLALFTNRGFTGHEHIDELNLIHMNGRVYDPELGRFLSPDPYIQEPYNTQSFNRYAYVQNNPLRYTDPSGYSWDDGDMSNVPGFSEGETLGDWRNQGNVVPNIQLFETSGGFYVNFEENPSWNTIGELSSAIAFDPDLLNDPLFDEIWDEAIWDVPVELDLEYALAVNDYPYYSDPYYFDTREISPTGPTWSNFVEYINEVGPWAASFSVLGWIGRSKWLADGVGKAYGWFGRAPKRGLGNPFKDKTAKEIDEMFSKKGFTKSSKPGHDAVDGYGGYVNPKTGRSYHIDPKGWGKYREPNHIDVNRPRGYKGPLDKKQLPYKGD
ncbi:MAG: RHS repeat-associated core domain-containing protein [Sedimenticola sp.]